MKTSYIATLAISGMLFALVNPIAASAVPITDLNGLIELEQIVIPSGKSKTISLPKLPADAVSVQLILQTAGAWRYTNVTAFVGKDGAKKTVAEPTDRKQQTHTVDLAVPSNSTKTLTFASSEASVKIRSAVVSYERATPPVVTSDSTGAIAELETIVVPSGKSKTIAFPTLPDDAVAVELTLQTSGAWRYTKVTASVGKTGTKKVVAEPTNDKKQNQKVTLSFPVKSDKTITFSSSQASVNIRTAVMSYRTASSKFVPAPTPKPKPAPVVKPTSSIPDDSNTGVPAGTKLTIHEGNLTIDTPGTVINGLDIRGKVNISAKNVTIKNSIIRGKSDTTLLVNNLKGHAGLKIIDSEIFAATESPNSQGIYGYNFTLTRVNIHNVIDGAHLTGGNVTIQDSWIHDNLHYVKDPNFNGSPSHDDSIQIQAGSNILITGNTLSGPWNANAQITQDTGVVSDVTFTNNNFTGGKCSINIAEKSYGPLKGIVIKDNKFAQDTRLANCAIIAKTTTKIDLANNFYKDGTLVTVRRG